jgi:hypothetical protein
MAVSLRGLKHVRTLAGKVDACAIPYRGFMQITCLEMEKARRHAERASAARRIRDIDERLEEIEKEKRALLAAVAPSAAPAHASGIPSRPVRNPAGGFRIRY